MLEDIRPILEIWTVIKILNWTIDFFRRKSLANPKFDAEFLISNALNINRLELYLNFDMPVEQNKRELIKKYILQRAEDKPLQYILGHTYFYGYKFFVDSRVLIPRPETERLVEFILREDNTRKIFDIGTGSGAIGITLAKELPHSTVTATDIDKTALKVAQKNAAYNDVKNVLFLQSDIFSNVSGKFDIIVSNPPYISQKEYEKLPKEIKNYEPKNALLAEDEGLFFYKNILNEAKDYLNKNGKIFLEIGYNQAKEIEKFAKKSRFSNVVITKDYNDFDRYIKIW